MTLRPALPYPANLCYNGCEVNMMTKTEARAQAKAMRKNLDLHAIGAAMTQQLFALPAWRQAGTVVCFVSMRDEPDTTAILQQALVSGKRLCVPRCLPGPPMPPAGGSPGFCPFGISGGCPFSPCCICGGVFSASAIALVENIANAKIQAIVFFIAGFISFI